MALGSGPRVLISHHNRYTKQLKIGYTNSISLKYLSCAKDALVESAFDFERDPTGKFWVVPRPSDFECCQHTKLTHFVAASHSAASAAIKHSFEDFF